MTSTKYIVLGGGMVAGYAAKELASRGLGSGELLIVSADDALPYERPPLSKGFLSGSQDEAGILINNAEWYRQQGIGVTLQTAIASLWMTPEKSGRARKAATEPFIVGGGFIGMEVAAVLAQKDIETTLILREDRVWSRVFADPMSDFLERYYTSRGVRLLKRETVVQYVDIIFEKRGRVEHWDNALSQGQHWAGLIRGERKPFSHVPYFFSDVFDLSYYGVIRRGQLAQSPEVT